MAECTLSKEGNTAGSALVQKFGAQDFFFTPVIRRCNLRFLLNMERLWPADRIISVRKEDYMFEQLR